MATKKCPVCGKASLRDMHGEFRFDPPANIPGGTIVIANASWAHCGACREDFIPPDLDRAIDKESKRRIVARQKVERA